MACSLPCCRPARARQACSPASLLAVQTSRSVAASMPESLALFRRHLLPALGHCRCILWSAHHDGRRSLRRESGTRTQSESLPELIACHPNSAGSSQFHRCITTSPKIVTKRTNAGGIRKNIHFLFIFSSLPHELVVNILESLPADGVPRKRFRARSVLTFTPLSAANSLKLALHLVGKKDLALLSRLTHQRGFQLSKSTRRK